MSLIAATIIAGFGCMMIVGGIVNFCEFGVFYAKESGWPIFAGCLILVFSYVCYDYFNRSSDNVDNHDSKMSTPKRWHHKPKQYIDNSEDVDEPSQKKYTDDNQNIQSNCNPSNISELQQQINRLDDQIQDAQSETNHENIYGGSISGGNVMHQSNLEMMKINLEYQMQAEANKCARN